MLTVTAVVIGAGYHYAITQVDEKIRLYFEGKLREHYQGLSVSVHSAELVEGEGVEIRGISIVQPTGEVLHAELAHIDEIVVKCSTDWQHLLSGDVSAEQVTIRRCKLNAVRRDDGSWSITRLFPLPKFGAAHPPVSIQQGAITLIDPQRGVESALVLREVDLSILPEVLPKEAISDAPPRLRLKGEIRGDQFERLTLEGMIDPVLCDWQLAGKVTGLKISSRLVRSVPLEVPQHADYLEGLRVSADLEYRTAGNFKSASSAQFLAQGRLRDGRYEHHSLPYAVTGIAGDFRCDTRGWSLHSITASSGGTSLSGSISGNRYDGSADFSLHLAAEQLLIDRRLVALLPSEAERVWRQFTPTGIVNADLRLHRRNGLYFPTAKIDCLDVAFAHEQFPYRLEHAGGSIQWHDGKIAIDLRAWAGRQAVNLKGKFDHRANHTAGSLTFATEGPLPIDQKMLSALRSKPEVYKVITSLQPRGALQVSGEIAKRANAENLDLQLNLGFHDCSLRYEKFPYPIDRIHGTAELRDGMWAFHRLEGRNDSGYILCDGSFESEGGLRLAFRCSQVPLEEELKLAMPPQMQKAWSSLRPIGILDQLLIDLEYAARPQGGEKQLRLSVTAVKQPEQPGGHRRGLSIEPSWFPYRIESLVGVARYEDGRIHLEQIQGRHGRTGMSCEGVGHVDEEGWALQINRFAVDRLHADAELLSVLPASFASVAERVQLQGPLSLQGAVTATAKHDAPASLETTWDITCDLEDGSGRFGVPLEHIHGGVRLIGGSSGAQFVSGGEITVDSLIYKGLQLLDVRGPIWFDRERFVAGGWIPADLTGAPPRRLTATVFGGRIEADAQVVFHEHAPFSLQAVVQDADLQQAARHFAPTLQNISGRAFAGVELQGDSTGSHTLSGRGQVRLREADIYELPVMLAMLKLLSVKRPDATAFTNSDVDFRIDGEHIYFDRIDFNGDAISLKGNGDADFQQRLNLKFYTLVGSDQLRSRFLESVLGEASKQILAIQVTGTATQPQVKREAFPGLNESLQQLFPELVQPREDDQPPVRSAVRRIMNKPKR